MSHISPRGWEHFICFMSHVSQGIAAVAPDATSEERRQLVGLLVDLCDGTGGMEGEGAKVGLGRKGCGRSADEDAVFREAVRQMPGLGKAIVRHMDLNEGIIRRGCHGQHCEGGMQQGEASFDGITSRIPDPSEIDSLVGAMFSSSLSQFFA